MRRFSILLIMIAAMVMPLFAQDTVEDIDGHDWRLWSMEQKLGYVQGFYSAYSSVWQRMYLSFGESVTEEDEARLEEWFYIPLGTGDMIDRIDAFYDDYDNRNELLYMVLMYAGGKDYWNGSRFNTPEEHSSTKPST